MQYRILGSTGLRVSVIGIGTWQFGGEWGKQFAQDEVDAMFQRGQSLGINLVDTAECYGDHESERLIGAAIQGVRDQWIIATKFGHKFHRPFERTDERSATQVVKQFEDSLKALRTDHVDLLQYHSVRDSEFDDDELHEALLKLKQAGKVRHLGTSISPNTNVHQPRRCNERQIEAVQVIYNRLDREAEQTVFPICHAQNVGVLARVPLASGLLSGKYKLGHQFDASEWRGRNPPTGLEQKLQTVQAIALVEVPPGTPMQLWALAWCLKHPAVTSVIPGCKTVAQVESNAAAADLSIEAHGTT